MDKANGFYTLKGYQLIENVNITASMEDYLEMICRIMQKYDFVKIRDIAKKLNVKPSSASKMVQQLNQLGYIKAEKYGNITVTKKGMAVGNYLLYRHNVIHEFLCFLNKTQDELEETEKIEHFLNRTTVENLDMLMQKLISEQ